MAFVIDKQVCASCGSCIGNCPNRAIVRRGDAVCITQMCSDCGLCVRYCTTGAVGPGPARAERDVKKLAQALQDRLDLRKFVVAMELVDEPPEDIAAEPGPHFWCGVCGEFFEEEGSPVFFTAAASSCGGCANIGLGAKSVPREEFDAVLDAQVVGEGNLYATRQAMSQGRNIFPRYSRIYAGMVVGPLARVKNPDMVLFCATPRQLCMISTAYGFETGEVITGFAGKSTCLMTVATPMENNRPVFCAGDHGGRTFMRLEDDELLVCFPFSLVPGLVKNLGRTVYAQNESDMHED